jgi:L-fuculose-phosphate aldolase
MNQYRGGGEFEMKRMICEIGKRIWTRGYVAANDGNITVKLNDKEVLTTPTGVSKGFMTPDMIIKVDMSGKVLSGSSNYRPSSEAKMHIEVYEQRSDIGSVIHAHPPYCTSFAVSGIPLNKCVLPEAILVLGAVPTAKYGLPSTHEIPDAIRPHIQTSDAILLENHGALTLGPDLLTAYHRMETLEHTAHIVAIALQLGNLNVLPREEVDRLMDLREKFNIPGRVLTCEAAGSCAVDSGNKPSEDMVQDITRKVMERLKNK